MHIKEHHPLRRGAAVLGVLAVLLCAAACGSASPPCETTAADLSAFAAAFDLSDLAGHLTGPQLAEVDAAVRAKLAARGIDPESVALQYDGPAEGGTKLPFDNAGGLDLANLDTGRLAEYIAGQVVAACEARGMTTVPAGTSAGAAVTTTTTATATKTTSTATKATATEQSTEYKPFGGSQIIGPNDKFTGGRHGEEAIGAIAYEPYNANSSSVLMMHIDGDTVYAKHATYDGKTFTMIFYTIGADGKEKEIGRAADPRAQGEEVQNIVLATPDTKRTVSLGSAKPAIQSFYVFSITDKGDAWYQAAKSGDNDREVITDFTTYVEYKNGQIAPFVY